jgi:hypothetical protein
MMSPLSGDT